MTYYRIVDNPDVDMEETWDTLIGEGSLAEVKPCEHGNYAPHSVVDPQDEGGFGPRPRVTCPGTEAAT